MFGSRKDKRIYADHAAATPLDSRVFEAMRPHFLETLGNAGSIHAEGVAAKRVIEEARKVVAREIGAGSNEVIFTSGGTEANNLAIFGVAEQLVRDGKKYEEMHFVTLAIEHASVLECFKELERRGARVSYVGVPESGVARAADVLAALTKDTVLVSIMYANSEIGTIQPLREIGLGIKMFREAQASALPYFHTDAAQAPEYLPCNVASLGVDLLSIDAQKIYGPKGVGFLYKKQGLRLAPQMFGGRQESGLRPGTPPTPLIVGLCAAFEIASANRKAEAARLIALRDHFIGEVQKNIEGALLNGHPTERLPNNANFSFPNMKGEYLVLKLDQRGIAAGTRSACHVGEEGGSHVVAALGRGSDETLGAVRFVFGRGTTKSDVDHIVATLENIFRTS